MLPEAGDITIPDAAGDTGDGQTGGAEEFSGLVEAEVLQVALEADSIVLAEQSGEMTGTGVGDLRGDLLQSQRTGIGKGEVGNRALQRIGGGLAGVIVVVVGEAEPDGLKMTAGRVFGSSGIS